MRVRVHDERCRGHAMCAAVCPDVFSINEETGRAQVIVETVVGRLEGDIQAAQDTCPEEAIEIY